MSLREKIGSCRLPTWKEIVDDFKSTEKHISDFKKVARECGLGDAINFDRNVTKGRSVSKLVTDRGRIGPVYSNPVIRFNYSKDSDELAGCHFEHNGFYTSFVPNPHAEGDYRPTHPPSFYFSE